MIKSVKFSLLVLLTLTVVTACATGTIEPPPDEISVRLKWLHGVQFAGLYIAEQKGFFEEENLSVTLEEGGLDFDEFALIAAGQDDFGIVGGPQILVARSEGVPVKAVATIFRIDPSVYFALTESGIERLEDFIGKRVVINPANLKLSVILGNVGVDIDQIIGVPPSSGLETLYSGEKEIWLGYVTNQVVRARLLLNIAPPRPRDLG
jgi:ABC-type nitrate/sulfonate/bicarbonate transport system substrate-binding protein